MKLSPLWTESAAIIIFIALFWITCIKIIMAVCHVLNANESVIWYCQGFIGGFFFPKIHKAIKQAFV